jgi:hypothetical protein
MERHQPSLSAATVTLHNEFGMEHLLAGLLSRPDAEIPSIVMVIWRGSRWPIWITKTQVNQSNLDAG